MEDLSDRQMEQGMQENMAFRWFCGFAPEHDMPDFIYIYHKASQSYRYQGYYLIVQFFQEMLKEKG